MGHKTVDLPPLLYLIGDCLYNFHLPSTTYHLPSILPLPQPRLHPSRQALDPQKTLRVGLVVRAAAFHRCNAFVVQAVGTRSPIDDDISFI